MSSVHSQNLVNQPYQHGFVTDIEVGRRRRRG